MAAIIFQRGERRALRRQLNGIAVHLRRIGTGQLHQPPHHFAGKGARDQRIQRVRARRDTGQPETAIGRAGDIVEIGRHIIDKHI